MSNDISWKATESCKQCCLEGSVVASRRWGLPKIPNHKRERFGATPNGFSWHISLYFKWSFFKIWSNLLSHCILVCANPKYKHIKQNTKLVSSWVELEWFTIWKLTSKRWDKKRLSSSDPCPLTQPSLEKTYRPTNPPQKKQFYSTSPPFPFQVPFVPGLTSLPLWWILLPQKHPYRCTVLLTWNRPSRSLEVMYLGPLRGGKEAIKAPSGKMAPCGKW